jgi:broad specificity phosphatase PhoE
MQRMSAIDYPVPFDGCTRRRIWLVRHAEAAYFDERGRHDPNSRDVALTANGRAQATAMRDLLKNVTFDRAVCSGLPRTCETANIVLAERQIELEFEPHLAEIETGDRSAVPPERLKDEFAYALFTAGEDGAAFHRGERFDLFHARVVPAWERVLERRDWCELLMVAHGITNRVILAWVLGLPLAAIGRFEQDSCCLNVIDLDTEPGGAIRRRFLRIVNLTVSDPAKTGVRRTTVESLALRYLMQH